MKTPPQSHRESIPADEILDRFDANCQCCVRSFLPNSHLRLTWASFCGQLKWPIVGEVSRTSAPPVLFRASVRHTEASSTRLGASVDPTEARKASFSRMA